MYLSNQRSVLDLDHEVAFFWITRWSPAKTLFLWNRYYSLILNLLMVACAHLDLLTFIPLIWCYSLLLKKSLREQIIALLFMAPPRCNSKVVLFEQPTSNVREPAVREHVQASPKKIKKPNIYSSGAYFFHGLNLGGTIQVMTTHLILQLRIWAMYGRTRKILYFLSS
ncbi:hypothetical protein M422DRAFT_56240 [Sphaerobolus stellatus SS14]|uniref:DUF6533 domain-containing protein n=1 Tax=Sphaerobolus stellatus (strain SS14) TaxID=990650 RepID=A0A0C9TSN0_SPHS4|nr:hypothetical protein M422DRAFT_56240 [Sphaerobolus stellatus SS14]